eukprot:9806626-Alexandrium_andersonii.AAC.2
MSEGRCSSWRALTRSSAAHRRSWRRAVAKPAARAARRRLARNIAGCRCWTPVGAWRNLRRPCARTVGFGGCLITGAPSNIADHGDRHDTYVLGPENHPQSGHPVERLIRL